MKQKLLILTTFFTLFSVNLFSSSDGGMHWNSFFGKTVNSIILFGVLFIFLKTPIIKYFTKKSKETRLEITRLKSSLENTKKQFKSLDRKLGRMDKIISKLEEEEKQSGLEIMKTIQKETLDGIQKLQARQKKELKEKQSVLVNDLKKKISEEIIVKFTEELKKDLSNKLHDHILEGNIKLIGENIE